ncbi:MAG: glycosyltransferase family 39 protein [Methylotetracoccus sp.]
MCHYCDPVPTNPRGDKITTSPIRSPARFSDNSILPHRSAPAAIALAIGLFTVLWGLGSYPLLQPDEGRNAEVAREMLEAGNWLVPLYNGQPYLDKPAFFFRAVALSLGLLGTSETAARLPSALFALGTLGLVHLFCRRFYDARTAATAVAVIACSLLYVAFARYVIFDMTLAFFVSAAILACFTASASSGPERRRLYTAAAFSAACATLVKGPVGFILPTLVTALSERWGGHRSWWRDAFRPFNVALFFAIVLLWFVWLSIEHPDFPYYGLVKESFQRFTSNEFRRTQPIYFYAVVIAIGMFPWCLLLPEGIVAAWRERGIWPRPDRLFVVWALAVVVFFSLSKSKLPGYILTATVALGVLIARLLVQATDAPPRDPRRTMLLRAVAVLGAIAFTAAAAAVIPLLRPSTLDLLSARSAVYLRDLIPAFAWLAAVLLITGLLAAAASVARSPRMAATAFFAFPLLLVPTAIAYLPNYAAHRSAAVLPSRMPALPADATVACFRCYPNGFSFYSGRLVTVISANDGYEMQSNYVRYALTQRADWPDRIVRERDFAGWLGASAGPIYLLAKQADLGALRAVLAPDDPSFDALTHEYSGVLLTARDRSASQQH